MLPLLAFFAQAGVQIGAEAVSTIIKEGVQWLKEKEARGEIEDKVKLKIANEMLEVGNRALEVRSALMRDPAAIDYGVVQPDDTIPGPS